MFDFILFRMIILFSFQPNKYFYAWTRNTWEIASWMDYVANLSISNEIRYQLEMLSLHKKMNGFLRKQKY